MIERLQSYFEKLEGLSSEQLDRSVEKLVRNEKRNTALVIAHLAEMSRRKAALERGYKSLFDYAVRRLHLSEGSVALRLQVANVSRRFPQILLALAENRISRTVAGLLAPNLTQDNVDKLIADCAGFSKRTAEEYLVAIHPKPVFAPSVRRVPPRPASPPPPPAHQMPNAPLSNRKTVSMTASPPSEKPLSILQPATPEEYNFRFAAGKEFKEKLERLAQVLGIENPSKNMAEILGRALDLALDKKDPERKLAQRRDREARRVTKSARKTRPDKVPSSEHITESRYIPSEVRERVHERAGYRCEYKSPDGTRCRSRTSLEIEHTRPFAIFHSHDERFLRLYCRGHNGLSAERAYGAAFIRHKIADSRGMPSQRGAVNSP